VVRTVGAVAITDDQISGVIARIGEGLTLKQSCKLAKFDYINVVKRIGASQDLKQLHARAREEYIRTRVQDMHDIAKNSKIDPQRARVMIDVIKWEAARVLPKEYGDRVQQEVIITNNTTLSQRMTAARARAALKVPILALTNGEEGNG
jgi:hypothetical protein